jgi:opacity protein-like surface antigen
VQGAVDYRLVETYTLGVPGVEDELDVRSVPVTVTGRLYLPAGERVRLFAAAGAGWYYVIYDYSDDLEGLGAEDENEHSFGWHIGGGLDVDVAPDVSLYFEGRAVFVDPDRDLDDATFDDVEELDYDSTYFAGGVTFHF